MGYVLVVLVRDFEGGKPSAFERGFVCGMCEMCVCVCAFVCVCVCVCV